MLAWGASVSERFRTLVAGIADRLTIDPSWVMASMAFETGRSFSPSIRNRVSGATGLIQFMPSTARRMGTTVEDLAALTAEEQLAWVEAYFKPYAGRIDSLADCYMVILWPAAVGKPDDYVLATEGAAAYFQNKGLDLNADGRITKAEAASKVAALLAEGLRPEHATPLTAPIEDQSTEAGDATRAAATVGGADNSNAVTTQQGGPMPIAIGLLAQLLPSVLNLFSGRAQAAIADKTGADPKLAEQFMQGLIQRVGNAVGLSVKDDGSAIGAVAELRKQVEKQNLDIKALEDEALNFLHDLTEAASALVDVRKREVEVETASMDAAAARNDASVVRERIDRKVWWAYGVAAGLLATIAIVELVVNKLIDGQIVGALILAFGGLGGAIITMVNYGYGSSGSSGAKDLVMGEMARRLPQGGKG